MFFTNVKYNLQYLLGGSANAFVDIVVIIIKIIAILFFSVLIVKLGSYIIRKLFEKQKKFKYSLDDKKVNTMSTLLVSIYRYTVYIIAIIIIFSDVFDFKSILAAAGIGGIAVGFGAQSLIKDVISGFFIVMEDQFAVGDLITTDNMSGTVEEMELRVTKIRNFNGDLYIIPNGEIKKVTNHTRGNKSVIVDIPIAYSADINKALSIAEEICRKAEGEFDTIVEPPKVLGITELGKESLNMRVTAKTVPNEQWEVERRVRKLVKEEFEKQGITFFDKNRFMVDGSIKGGGAGG